MQSWSERRVILQLLLLLSFFFCSAWGINVTVLSAMMLPVPQSRLTLWPHGLQHARPPCPPLYLGAFSSSCPLNVLSTVHSSTNTYFSPSVCQALLLVIKARTFWVGYFSWHCKTDNSSIRLTISIFLLKIWSYKWSNEGSGRPRDLPLARWVGHNKDLNSDLICYLGTYLTTSL